MIPTGIRSQTNENQTPLSKSEDLAPITQIPNSPIRNLLQVRGRSPTEMLHIRPSFFVHRCQALTFVSVFVCLFGWLFLLLLFYVFAFLYFCFCAFVLFCLFLFLCFSLAVLWMPPQNTLCQSPFFVHRCEVLAFLRASLFCLFVCLFVYLQVQVRVSCGENLSEMEARVEQVYKLLSSTNATALSKLWLALLIPACRAPAACNHDPLISSTKNS